MSRRSFSFLRLIGLSVWLAICSMWATPPKETKFDLYNHIVQAIWKTRKDKLKEELLEAGLIKKYAETYKICRKVGVSLVDIIPPGIKNETLPQAFQADCQDKLAQIMEEQKEGIIKTTLPVDYSKVVLLPRKEGVLTNKRENKELASLLRIIIEKILMTTNLMSKETENFDVDINEEDKKKG